KIAPLFLFAERRPEFRFKATFHGRRRWRCRQLGILFSSRHSDGLQAARILRDNRENRGAVSAAHTLPDHVGRRGIMFLANRTGYICYHIPPQFFTNDDMIVATKRMEV